MIPVISKSGDGLEAFVVGAFVVGGVDFRVVSEKIFVS